MIGEEYNMIRPELQELLEEVKAELMDMYRVADDSFADLVLEIQTAVKFVDYAIKTQGPKATKTALKKAYDVFIKDNEEPDDLVDRIRGVITESDYEHGQVLKKTGHWGKQGAGAIIMAKSTGKFLIPFRSSLVLQPNTWGVWGGAIDSGEDPKSAAKREVQEEAGYRGGDVIMVPLYVFHDQKSGFKYYNFLAVVDDEFTPNLNWETENFEWVDFDKIRHLEPLHFGLKALLQHSGDDIHKVVDKVKGSETINESDGNPIVISRQ